MDRSDPPVTIDMDTCPPCTGACLQGRACPAPRRADPMVVSVLVALAAFWGLALVLAVRGCSA